ncbi:twitching motility protein PilT [Ignicoccus pacificus DSM 13166]|uniref:Ribonuclease VapC n=1 Tax=Ignicoccus pacificus DSM 13166 TaxID=940294 RepID=A0A977K969_9CREN|nr:twitching motility protein PilT [Ignicoccus pacificus DSM 13166]
MERKVVVDASVVVKWFIEEEYSEQALKLLDAYKEGLLDLVAPSLLPYEVLNALKYSNVFGEDELKEVAIVLESLQITTFELRSDHARRSLEIAMRKGVTVYDASYVALAELENAAFYTADEKLLRKVKDLDFVKHIRDFDI